MFASLHNAIAEVLTISEAVVTDGMNCAIHFLSHAAANLCSRKSNLAQFTMGCVHVPLDFLNATIPMTGSHRTKVSLFLSAIVSVNRNEDYLAA